MKDWHYELDWIAKWAQYTPEGVAFVDGETDKTLTYSQLQKNVDQTSAWLQSRGVKPQDRLALLATNSLEAIELFFATQKIGAILAPINYRLTESEVAYIINDCSPTLILTTEELKKTVQSFPQVHTLSQLSQERESLSSAEISFQGQWKQTCMIIYTSGTTGFPKGAMITNEMLTWNAINTHLRLNITQHDSSVSFLPLFHTGGWNVLLTPFLHHGAMTVLTAKFDAAQILKLTEKYKCTLIFGVPTTMQMLASDPHFAKTDLSSVRYAIVGGEPMPIPLIQTWHDRGIKIRQGYGLTEFGPNVFSLNEEHAISKIGSIGFANFYIDIKVVNEQGQPVTQGEIGELLLCGPMMMAGYWNNPKATAETIREGWLYTGDLVRQDEQGFTFVVGRKKDMYKSGGENVYPAEVERVIAQIPGIKEVAVIGMKDEKWGETGCAFVVTQQKISVEEILKHCQEHLAKFKVPKHVQFLEALPKGDSGKILKKALRLQ